MPGVLAESAAFADELIADFIETGDFKGEKGIVWAIRYFTKKDLSELKTRTSKSELQRELKAAEHAEKSVLDGFETFVPTGRAAIVLTKEEKTKNIAFYVEDVATLFSLRNKKYPQELSKLEVLRSKSDTPDYVLVIKFWRRENGRPFVRSVRIEKSLRPTDEGESWKWSKGSAVTEFA